MKIFIILFLLFINGYANYISSEDSKNYYLESQHFKVIAGIEYKNDLNIQNKMIDILDAAENSWDVEVNQLGFNEPRNIQNNLIDIYIGNIQAYNYEYSYYQEIDPSYAGWASSYSSDNTPFFVLSDIISEEELKTTIAHEFFHAIEYSYFQESNILYDKWIKNIWWLEATAVLMEDEVYDNINGYIYFANKYFNNTEMPIETFDGSHEYSLVIFAKYIKEKFGFDIIKKSLESLETSGDDGFFEILDTIFKDDYNSSMNDELINFALWISDPLAYFEEGELYNNAKKFSIETNSVLDKGALKILNNSRILLNSGTYVAFDIKSGWNFVGTPANISSGDLALEYGEIAWVYKDNVWEYFTKYKTGDIAEGEAIWLSKTNSDTVSFKSNLTGTNSIINDGWNMVSPIEANLDVKAQFAVKSNYQAIFGYENKAWKVYAPNFDTSSYDSLDNVKIGQGVWIKAQTQDIADNFNLVLDIEEGDYSDFRIGARFDKLSTGAYGEFLIFNDKIHITGTKSDGTKGSKTYQKGSDVYDAALRFDKDKLYLNIDDVFEIQDIVSASTLKAQSKYDIFIYSDNVNFKNASIIDEKVKLTNYGLISTDYQFDIGSSMIKKIVEIK